MILIDYSSVLYRMVSGSIMSLMHVHAENHNLQIGQKVHHNYNEIGVVTHIINENEFTFTIKYGIRLQDINGLSGLNSPKLNQATKMAGYKYPLSAFKEVFDNVFFNNITGLHNQFGPTYGKIVFCLDKPTNKGYWRKRFLPSYKAKRAGNRDSSAIDFSSLYEYVNKELLPLLESCVPCTIHSYNQAEGDDIIAVLANKLKHQEHMIIISEDKDLKALVDDRVTFYRPMLSRYAEKMTDTEREDYIRLHSIFGDESDNIQNATLNTKYNPIFLKWLKEKHNISLHEYDVLVFEKQFGKDNVNKYYMEFIEIYHKDKLDDVKNGKFETISSKVFKHYWMGEKTIKETLLNENFHENIKQNPLWMDRIRLNRKLVDPYLVPKYMVKGILNTFVENNASNYELFEQALKKYKVLKHKDILQSFFPNRVHTVDW